ncbi:helix-turn-helix domain-containing protein [Arthrobacter sp. UYCu712]|uniref:helix-turn-helix domain-containing protein n=1 Tax=Arthrobacter sp. UYCu712 TaxID=3156340 RepID=UPI00339922E2
MSSAKAIPQTAPAPDDDLLSIKQVSEMTGCSSQALYNHRHRGTGPECSMVKGRLKYRRSAVLEWVTKADTATLPEPAPAPHGSAAMTTAEVLDLPPSVDLETACRAFRISPATGYRLVKSNGFPCPVVRLGRAIRVPKTGLLRVLGLDGADHTSPTGS